MKQYVAKNLVIDNIKNLAKRKNVKLGELEKHCNVSAGYLSRLYNNKDPHSYPSVEFLMLAGEILNLSVDDLLSKSYYEYERVKRSDIEFLEKLIKDTMNRELTWLHIPNSRIINKICKTEGYNTNHSLFKCFDGTNIVYSASAFSSALTPIKDVTNMYRVMFADNAFLYIVELSKRTKLSTKDYHDYELVTVKGDDVRSLYSTYDILLPQSYNKAVQDLYNIVKDSDSGISIDQSLKESIDEFMDDQEDYVRTGIFRKYHNQGLEKIKEFKKRKEKKDIERVNRNPMSDM